MFQCKVRLLNNGLAVTLLVMLFCLLCVIWLPRWFQAQTCYEVPGLPAFTEAYLEENNLCQAESSILQNNE